MKFIGQACLVALLIHSFVIPLLLHANRWYLNDLAPLAYTVRTIVGEIRQLGAGERHANWIEYEFLRTGVPHEIIDGDLIVRMPTAHYQNFEGENSFSVFVEEGEFPNTVVLKLPFLFQFSAGWEDQRVPKLPAAQYALTLLQLDYDPRDGEVRGRIQLANFQPQADGSFHELFMQLRNEVEAVASVLTPAGTQTMPYRGRRGLQFDGDVTTWGGLGI